MKMNPKQCIIVTIVHLKKKKKTYSRTNNMQYNNVCVKCLAYVLNKPLLHRFAQHIGQKVNK